MTPHLCSLRNGCEIICLVLLLSIQLNAPVEKVWDFDMGGSDQQGSYTTSKLADGGGSRGEG